LNLEIYLDRSSASDHFGHILNPLCKLPLGSIFATNEKGTPKDDSGTWTNDAAVAQPFCKYIHTVFYVTVPRGENGGGRLARGGIFRFDKPERVDGVWDREYL
jgi:hypothetical protein